MKFILLGHSCRLLSSGSLVLLSPSTEDEGYFECTAVNDAGEERRVIEVILQGNDFGVMYHNQDAKCNSDVWTLIRVSSSLVPPSIEDDVTAVKAVKMSSAVLPCHVHGRPQPTITWTKSGAQLSTRGGSYRVLPTGKTVNLSIGSVFIAPHTVLFSCCGHFATGVLEITAALPSHAGRYTCSARNTAGVAHKHITLTVQGRFYRPHCQSECKHDTL